MKTRIPVEMEEEIRKAFKLKCLQNDESMSGIMRKFAEAYIRDPKGVTKFIYGDDAPAT